MFHSLSKRNILRRIRCHLKSFPSSTSVSLKTTNNVNAIYDIVDEDDFRTRVMQSRVPVIVNFHADWCEPCLELRPILQEIARKHPEEIHLAEISVDEHAELLQAFEVTAVPAVIGIQKGIVVGKFVGLVSDKEIKAFVEKILLETKTR